VHQLDCHRTSAGSASALTAAGEYHHIADAAIKASSGAMWPEAITKPCLATIERTCFSSWSYDRFAKLLAGAISEAHEPCELA
jgi:hypothetical protein